MPFSSAFPITASIAEVVAQPTNARATVDLAPDPDQPAVIVSPLMVRFYEQVKRAALSNAAVLITGETGVGKELVARAIHNYSRRQTRAWVDLSCAALPEHLLESELFGHERGAFSGAESAKPGLFELAHQGTIFLDEIGELDARMQAKLLRILDGAAYYRLGGVRKVSTDVRVVAATNEDLERAVAERRFRRDLFHRLSQIRLHVPPLRERVEDLAPLATFFLHREYPTLRLDSGALARLEQYHWPGNVRELRNVVAQAAALTTKNVLGALDLVFGSGLTHVIPAHDGSTLTKPGPMPVGSARQSHPSGLSAPSGAPNHSNLGHAGLGNSNLANSNLEEMERQMILRALALTGGHQIKAAAHLGISRRTLSRKLKLYSANRSQLAS